MKILLVDNYDSFTYNLVHYLEASPDVNVVVKRNDEIDLKSVSSYDRIVLSPGPGLPSEAGVLLELIRQYVGKKPVLGVCLGLQAIAEVYGSRLLNLQKVYHGTASRLRVISPEPLFKGLPDSFLVGRYHSWVMDPENIPDCLEVTATDEEGNIMAIRHRKENIHAVQFHPESILTEHGHDIINNWLKFT
jgi:anthranilate synthase component 2